MRPQFIPLTLIVSAFLATSAWAGISFSLSAPTGDVNLDATLRGVNVEAQASLPTFYSSVSVSFGVPAPVVEHLVTVQMMSPADAYVAVRVATITNRSVDVVVTEYKRNKGKGWGVIAKNLGIKPGSKEFHELKAGGTIIVERSKKERGKSEAHGSDKGAAKSAGSDDQGSDKGKGRDNDQGKGGGKGQGKKK